MKTIENKLQAAHDLGRIVGAAECFADEDVRNTVCGAAHALFDGLLTEAEEDEKVREEGASALRYAYTKVVVDRAVGDYPPDPFDFVETGEMVEKEPEPKKQTNFSELTKSPESLAEFLSAQPYCGRGEVVGDCNEDCYPCVLKWLNEEIDREERCGL